MATNKKIGMLIECVFSARNETEHFDRAFIDLTQPLEVVEKQIEEGLKSQPLYHENADGEWQILEFINFPDNHLFKFDLELLLRYANQIQKLGLKTFRLYDNLRIDLDDSISFIEFIENGKYLGCFQTIDSFLFTIGRTDLNGLNLPDEIYDKYHIFHQKKDKIHVMEINY